MNESLENMCIVNLTFRRVNCLPSGVAVRFLWPLRTFDRFLEILIFTDAILQLHAADINHLHTEGKMRFFSEAKASALSIYHTS